MLGVSSSSSPSVFRGEMLMLRLCRGGWLLQCLGLELRLPRLSSLNSSDWGGLGLDHELAGQVVVWLALQVVVVVRTVPGSPGAEGN